MFANVNLPKSVGPFRAQVSRSICSFRLMMLIDPFICVCSTIVIVDRGICNEVYRSLHSSNEKKWKKFSQNVPLSELLKWVDTLSEFGW